MTLPNADLLRALDDAVAARTPDIVDATRTLVGFRTESVDLLAPGERLPNEEAALQAWVADRLEKAGCVVDQWEPDASALAGHRLIPPWHHWQDRPMTVGRRKGSGGGRSLIINGHVDVVPAGDPDRWSHPPFAADVSDGRVHGRGTADMKGGIAAALVALEILVACGVRLHGDVLFQAVTDEEIGGMGTIAAAERGYLADAAVMPEPSGLRVVTATRGILHARLQIDGRAAHAEVNQPSWRNGGGVNANHIGIGIASALMDLGTRRQADPALRHPSLSAPSLQITRWRGGDYIATVPNAAELLVNATYLPAEADAAGCGAALLRDLDHAVIGAGNADGWLDEHPPAWTVLLDYPSYEIPDDAPIVTTVLDAARSAGIAATTTGVDSGYDGAVFGSLYRTPSVAFGPGNIAAAHTVDEFVDIDDLVRAARAMVRLMVEWCGVEV